MGYRDFGESEVDPCGPETWGGVLEYHAAGHRETRRKPLVDAPWLFELCEARWARLSFHPARFV